MSNSTILFESKDKHSGALLTFTGETKPLPTLPFLGECQNVDNYKKLNEVGKGTYGIVYRAKHSKSNNIVAIKKIKMEFDEGMPISSVREISLLKSVNHKNIVNVFEVVVGQRWTSVFMVMEYCEQDLANLIDNMSIPYTPMEVKCIVKQTCQGLKYLHDNLIIHRDLKLSNLLINSKGIVKVGIK